jgi:hypothetical protein
VKEPHHRAVGRLGRLGNLRLATLIGMLAAAAVGGCAPTSGSGEPISQGDPTAPPMPPSPVVGVVVDIASAGLGEVERFNLRLPDGTTIVLQMGTLENAVDFPPAHLAEHQATSSPIRAFYRIGPSGEPEVYRLEDAVEPSL